MVDVTEFDPISGRVKTERTVTRSAAVRRTQYFVRLPTVPEFDQWLEAAGFFHRGYSDRRGAALTCESWRLVVSATKGP